MASMFSATVAAETLARLVVDAQVYQPDFRLQELHSLLPPCVGLHHFQVAGAGIPPHPSLAMKTGALKCSLAKSFKRVVQLSKQFTAGRCVFVVASIAGSCGHRARPTRTERRPP